MKIKKSLFSMLISVGIIIVVSAFFVFFTLFKNSPLIQNPLGAQCFSVEKKIVQGNSMSGIIEPGKTVKIFSGYYKCNEAKRGDIIIYSYAGDKNPLIKVVRGISGDGFGFQKNNNGWSILLNGEIVKNAQNLPYLLNERGYNMLSLYEKDYKGKIPENSALIFGNLVGGSMDSTYFGLIDVTDILGKVEY